MSEAWPQSTLGLTNRYSILPVFRIVCSDDMDHIRRILNTCNISVSNLEQISTDRHSWKVPVPMAWQHTTWLQIKQLRIDVPVGTILPTCQLLVRDAHSAAESVLPSSACAVIYGVISHVHISNTPSSTNVIVELDAVFGCYSH